MADRAPVRQVCEQLGMQWLQAHVVDSPSDGVPGSIAGLSKKALAVNTATSQLHITRFRIEGGKGAVIDAAALRNGYQDTLVTGASCRNP